MNKFEKLGLSPFLLETIEKIGFKEPTTIQEKSIPFILKGKDVIGESATGSGKTLAFGAGIIENVVPDEGLQALVLTPTRELAEQVKNALQKFSVKKRLNILSVYGGVSMQRQIENLPKSEVVVATPGRLLDLLQRRRVNTSKIKILVVDEADRMFDMGFIDDVERIIKTCPENRQTLFFSATISSRVKGLGKRFMKEQEMIYAEKMVDPSKLKQIYYDTVGKMKLSLLAHLLKTEKGSLSMVFCNTRRVVDFVSKNLNSNGIKSISIHGGLTQNKRDRTINLFNKGKVNVLVCTDVAARGLHIPNVTHIFNYDIPRDSKDYVHRIGRTARAGETGKVINLLIRDDYDNFSKVLEEYSTFEVNKVETPKFNKLVNVQSDNRWKQGRKAYGTRRGNRPRRRNKSSGHSRNKPNYSRRN